MTGLGAADGESKLSEKQQQQQKLKISWRKPAGKMTPLLPQQDWLATIGTQVC